MKNEAGGSVTKIRSGETLVIESGATLQADSGSTINLADALEGPGDIALVHNHIMVGDSTGKAADVALSGDATIADTGAITVVSMGGKKIARGVTAVTGTNDLTTGLATVVALVASLAEDPDLTADRVTSTLQTQSGGTAGHVTLKVWKPTGSGDCTPIASVAAKNVAWVAVGT